MRTLIFNAFFFGMTTLMTLVAWPIARFGTRRALWRWIGLWARMMLSAVRVILGARVEVRGRQNLAQDRPQLIVSKHQSWLDVVVICAILRDFNAVVMEELKTFPFFSTILDGLGVVLVSVKKGSQGATEDVVKAGKRARDEGRRMLIFPEGKLMEVGAKERYRSGAGHLYRAMGVEAVPVALSLGLIWPRREWRKNPGAKAAIEFLEPIPPGKSLEAFMAEVERRIEDGTMRLIREQASGDELATAEDRHARADWTWHEPGAGPREAAAP